METMTTDWLYSSQRLNLRGKTISSLLRRFGSHMRPDGSPEHSSKSIYECAHDWISQGNTSDDGVIEYYKANYS